jgi:hypothetical protein
MTIKGYSVTERRCLRRKSEVKNLVTLSLQGMDFFRVLRLIAFILAQKVLYPEVRFASNVCSKKICIEEVKSAHKHHYYL